jgi:hypothetical protein
MVRRWRLIGYFPILYNPAALVASAPVVGTAVAMAGCVRIVAAAAAAAAAATTGSRPRLLGFSSAVHAVLHGSLHPPDPCVRAPRRHNAAPYGFFGAVCRRAESER